MKKVYRLENLDCANCAAKIENAIREIDGIDNVSVSFMTQKLSVETSRDIGLILAEIKKVIDRIEPDCEIIE